MEKASKILVILFVLACAYLAWSVFSSSNESKAEVLDKQIMAVSGPSMIPTLHAGDIVHYSVTEPQVGNIVIFTCHSPRCLPKVEEVNGPRFIKRLTTVENDCYTFLGDNPEESFDSRSYGALCGNEIELEGVVTSVDFSK